MTSVDHLLRLLRRIPISYDDETGGHSAESWLALMTGTRYGARGRAMQRDDVVPEFEVGSRGGARWRAHLSRRTKENSVSLHKSYLSDTVIVQQKALHFD